MKPLQSIIVPHEIVNDEFVTIVQCHFNNGDRIKEGDPLITIETSKMVEDLYAAFGGYIYYLCQEGSEIKIGEVIIEIYDQPLIQRSALTQETVEKRETSLPEDDVIFSQSALRMIEELKMSKEKFKGRTFVSTEDVRFVQRQISQNQFAWRGASESTHSTVPGLKSGDCSGLTLSGAEVSNFERMTASPDIEFLKISPIKKREIENLNAVQSSHLSNVVSMLIDVTSFIDKLKRESKFFKNSLLLIVISKLPALLEEYPEFNAFYKDGTIGFYKNIAIGFAVNLGDGLRVLKLPVTNEKSIAEIEIMIFDMIKQYLDKKLTPQDLARVTFTVTDLSNEGIHFFIPLIPKGQSAILGISAIDEKLQRSIVSLSFDHRVTDGKKASEFLRKLKKRIEADSVG